MNGKKSYLISFTALFSKRGYELKIGFEQIINANNQYHLTAPVNSTYKTLIEDTMKNANKAPHSATGLFGRLGSAEYITQYDGFEVETVVASIVSYLSGIHKYFHGETVTDGTTDGQQDARRLEQILEAEGAALGFSVGDTMLSAIGISPYTTSYLSGVHITLFLGLGIFACGFYLTRKEIGKSFPGLAKGLWIVVIAIVLSYSYMTDKFMYVAKWGATGINAVSYVQNASSCTFNVLKTGETRATCDLTLKNYGRDSVSAVLLPDLARSYKPDT
ncbi:hypothetical protein ACS72_03340 [Acinetobacter sp. VT 511]|nr:hypothetical protein ACS72_03340 [Acinetobacter sp. VT 511]